MSDSFYAMELMVREKARWAEAEMQRRQMLAAAARSDSQGPRTVLRRYLGEAMMRAGHFFAASRKCFGRLMPSFGKGL